MIELYYGKIRSIKLNGKALGYITLNHWNVVSILIGRLERKLYESSKGYYIVNNGKRHYLDVELK